MASPPEGWGMFDIVKYYPESSPERFALLGEKATSNQVSNLEQIKSPPQFYNGVG
jgi:hypothetical protein